MIEITPSAEPENGILDCMNTCMCRKTQLLFHFGQVICFLFHCQKCKFTLLKHKLVHLIYYEISNVLF